MQFDFIILKLSQHSINKSDWICRFWFYDRLFIVELREEYQNCVGGVIKDN